MEKKTPDYKMLIKDHYTGIVNIFLVHRLPSVVGQGMCYVYKRQVERK